ncbi:MAG: PIN domain-containing protein [Candidatus Omnitrophica bacterium]|nr:PIN domain-containing protein [Candidatus Omnitrophota bacterium]MBU0896089.1 PIN domain-containing protein [Candidatus Omnitrophota bacterium]MBU1134713.1 PIN domain-containing protein [Candidatus Omnitrophota bacterium]MBU1367351.1 PIN domain-containing protein [Candidatus Omnitrophota bacterium]MBU1523562.1 PIN domain-containing protein [Candidatus Omnitrophota bacterium]
MKVLVDTCIWSQVLRHKNPNLELTKKMEDLINDGRVSIVGPIRQELLSGISDIKQFNQLKELLFSFEDVPLEAKHFLKAAEFTNICRSKGIQGSTTDFLICAVAYLENLMIFTTDNDFENYKKYLPIKLIK